MNSSWNKIIEKPIFLLKKLRLEDISLDVQKNWRTVAREIDDDQIEKEFVSILLKIFKENGIQFQPPEYIVDLAQARIIRAAKNGQLNILKFLVEFSSNTMAQWNPTVPTKTVGCFNIFDTFSFILLK